MSQLSGGAGERGVWVLVKTRPQTLKTLSDGTKGFFVHSSVWYGRTETDGPVKVEIAMNTDVAPMLPDLGLHLRILSLPSCESVEEPPIQGNRQIFEVGKTSLTNKGLFDVSKTQGFLMTVFLGDTTYRVGESFASDINDCNSYVRRLLAGMGLEIPKPLSNILAASDRWQGVQQELRVSIKHVGYLADGDPEPQVVKLHLEERCKGKSNMKREAYSLALAALVAGLLVGIIVSLGLPSLFVNANQPVIQRGMF